MRRNLTFFNSGYLIIYSRLVLIGLILIILSVKPVGGQCPIDAPFCQSATPLCSPFTEFILPEFDPNDISPFPGCSGNFTIDNPVWFSFVAESNFIVIDVNAFGCYNGAGYQVGLYESCDPGAPPYFVQCSCTPGPVNIQVLATPGQTYYMVVDGCAGDVCQISVGISQGFIQDCNLILDPPDAPVADNNLACPGQIINFSTNQVPGAVFYDWSFPPGVVPLDIDCATASVIWGNQPGNVTVTAIDNNGNSATSDPAFVDVYMPTGFEFGAYCFPEEPGYFHVGTGTYYPGGTWLLPLLTAAGCDSLVTLEVTEYYSDPAFVNFEICDGDTLDVNGELFTMPGTYTQVLTDATVNGCDSTLFITITSGNFSFATPVITDASCGLCNGAIDLQVICAQTPLSIAWSGGLPNDELLVTDLCAGSYMVTVTDANGVSISSTIDVEGLPGLNIQAAVSPVSCAGQSDAAVTITVVSGVPAYSYDWSDDSLDGQSTANGLAGGTYGLTVTDSEGCVGMVDVVIPEPEPLETERVSQHIRCNEPGRAEAIVTGGTSPYTYLWSNGGTSNAITVMEVGAYDVTVTDANNCTATIDYFITSPFYIGTDTLNTFETGVINDDTLFCGQVTDTLNAYNYPFGSYVWTTANGNISGNSDDYFIFVDAPGTYVVQISVNDDAGETCITEDTIVVVRECCPIDFFVQSQNESCRGIGDGRARVVIAGGGTPPFSFQWSDPDLPQEQEVTDLLPGNYSVTLTDATGCTFTQDFEITSYLDLMVTTTPADCDGAGGSATAFANGFFISYFWSNGGTGPTQTNLSVGEYTVTAWSIFGGCQSEQTVLIEIDSSCNDALDQLGRVDESTLEWEGNAYRNAPLNINTKAQKIGLQLSPNPIIDQTYLELNLTESQFIQLELYNAEGKILQEKRSQVNQGIDRIDLSFKNYPSGLYYLKVITADGRIEVIRAVKL